MIPSLWVLRGSPRDRDAPCVSPVSGGEPELAHRGTNTPQVLVCPFPSGSTIFATKPTYISVGTCVRDRTAPGLRWVLGGVLLSFCFAHTCNFV